MNNITLDTWVKCLIHWNNSAETLTIYALSDMFGVHTTILTKTKPWTTVHPSFEGDVYGLLKFSRVNLVYLGNHHFTQLWTKAIPDTPSHIAPDFNYAPIISLPPTPSHEEIETAHTLLQLQSTDTQEDTEIPAPSLHRNTDRVYH